jgi:tetratricopeptide (TPR) repeat protein
MRKTLISIFSFLILAIFSFNAAYAQDNNLLPKYGLVQKNEAQQAADKKFLTKMDELFKGDRKKAAEAVAMRGWQIFREGDTETALKRFNQSWLLDNKNGSALWGMAAIQGKAGKMDESLKLFSEAEQYTGNDIDFAVDHARAIGFTAVATRNEALVKDAFNRYDKLYKRAPQHILNLQNWAIVLYSMGNYAEAWKKIKLAEAAPRTNELDKNFIADLQKKMPRPK